MCTALIRSNLLFLASRVVWAFRCLLFICYVDIFGLSFFFSGGGGGGVWGFVFVFVSFFFFLNYFFFLVFLFWLTLYIPDALHFFSINLAQGLQIMQKKKLFLISVTLRTGDAVFIKIHA